MRRAVLFFRWRRKLRRRNLLERALQSFRVICTDLFSGFNELLRLLGIVGFCWFASHVAIGVLEGGGRWLDGLQRPVQTNHHPAGRRPSSPPFSWPGPPARRAATGKASQRPRLARWEGGRRNRCRKCEFDPLYPWTPQRDLCWPQADEEGSSRWWQQHEPGVLADRARRPRAVCRRRPPKQLRQLGDVGGDAPGFVAGQAQYTMYFACSAKTA